MSLILAVEPDRRQAAHLTHVVRQRVGAELVLAETTELALASIGNRVPDLILVPPLLSPQDDAALAAALRVIASAAHVQMVTTPMFASASPEGRGRGVLSAFRRSKPKAAPDGCDPAEFAQQISSYLESAAEKRADAQFVESPVVAPVARPEATVTSSDRYVPLGPGQLYRDEGAVLETASETLSAEPIERIYEPPAFEPPQQVDAAPVNEDVPDLPIIEALHDVEDTPVLEDVPVVEDVPVLEAAARVDE